MEASTLNISLPNKQENEMSNNNEELMVSDNTLPIDEGDLHTLFSEDVNFNDLQLSDIDTDKLIELQKRDHTLLQCI